MAAVLSWDLPSLLFLPRVYACVIVCTFGHKHFQGSMLGQLVFYLEDLS